jgi:hypothetical protein
VGLRFTRSPEVVETSSPRTNSPEAEEGMVVLNPDQMAAGKLKLAAY